MTCTPSLKFQEDISAYRDEIRKLQQRLSQNPQDAEALRDLGAIYFQTGRYAQAKTLLTQSAKLNAGDAKTLLYLGLSLEFDNRPELALQVYQKYPQLPRSRFRKLMEGRYLWLTREMVRREMQRVVNNPLEAKSPDPAVLAVFPLIYQGKDRRYAALGRGIAEMLLTDLGQIPRLKLVERVRLSALLEELERAQQPYTDPATAPRPGRLLGAGQIIGGAFNVLNKRQVQMNLSYWNIAREMRPAFSLERRESLQELFRMEKEVALEIVGRLGIELTPEIREKILRIPTRNLQAFLAYCRGLVAEDEGRFGEAAEAFREAASLDPNFQQARQRSEEMETLSQAGGKPEEAKVAVRQNDPVFRKVTPEPTDLIGERLENLGNHLDANFIPGEDTRKPTEESLPT
ncbi:MAG: tetratricopeptide repeat protein, partial [Calditrichaeota bacterium]